MSRNRFVQDRGLTVRMTTVLFLLGALFVVFMVVLMYVGYAFGGAPLVVLVGLAGSASRGGSGSPRTSSRSRRCGPGW